MKGREVKKLEVVSYLNSEATKLLNSEATQHLNNSPFHRLNILNKWIF